MAFYSNSFLHRIQLVIALCAICLVPSCQSIGGTPIYPQKKCPDTGDGYTAGSTFESNLGVLLRSLSTKASATGYAADTFGGGADRISGLVLCRGDIQARDCVNCLDDAASNISKFCPNNRSAIVWYEKCLLRYSNELFLGTPDSSLLRNYMRNLDFVSFENSVVFVAFLREVLGGLTRYAVENLSAQPPMFAAGEMNLRLIGDQEISNLYGLVQCTQDISHEECRNCLQDLFDYLPECCPRRLGAVVLAASCNIRYEPYKFSNWTGRLVFPLLAATPAEAPAVTSRGGNTEAAGVATGSKRKIGVVSAIILFLGLAVLLSVAFCCIYVRRRVLKGELNRGDEHIEDFESLRFDLPTIKSATCNFASLNILGRGGFGEVYKGRLPNGTEIAVKRLLKTSSQGLKELRNEVVLLAKLQHRNLVRILGVCLEGEEKLLVYEYIENKSLDTFLYDPRQKQHLTWERRYNIIRGIARGLLYLHEESQIKIIHRDLKASNILLDADMNPKISDFGIARLFGSDETHASTTRIAGTIGYMSPEYAYRGQFSVKSDVFSFGVLVLEIITGRKCTEVFSDETSDLLGYVWTNWSTGAASEILDQAVAGSYSQSEVYSCIQLGLLCVQELPASRPTMASVVLVLESYSTVIPNPEKPAMFARISAAAGLPMSDSSALRYDPSECLIDKAAGTAPESTVLS